MRLLLSALLFAALLPTAQARTIVAVFAHPDDETTVSGLLAKYAAAGHDVYLVTITSGQAGNANTDIPKGPELGKKREEETRCSARALGIHEPKLLGFEDGEIGIPPVMNQILPRLREIVEQVKPDVMITWGPDGVTGHPDHRTAHVLTTEVFQQRGLLKHHPRKLYYVAWPEDLLKNAPEPFNRPGFIRGVTRDFVSTAVDVKEFSEQTHASVVCHQTQWDEARIELNRELGEKALQGTVFLRLGISDTARSTALERDVFEGL